MKYNQKRIMRAHKDYKDAVRLYKMRKRLCLDSRAEYSLVLDARRRFRDEEEKGIIAKIKVVGRKINNKITELIQKHPFLSKIARIWLRIDSALAKISAGLGTAQLAIATLNNLDGFKQLFKLAPTIREKSGIVGDILITYIPNIITLILKPLLKAYIKRKLADEIEKRQLRGQSVSREMSR